MEFTVDILWPRDIVENISRLYGNRPQLVFAQQAIRGAFHEVKIVEVGPDSAQDSINKLQENRRLEQPAIDAMRKIVQMAGIITFVFELYAVPLSQKLVDALDVAKR